MQLEGTVLICDDDEKITTFLEQILIKKGNHKVIKTHSSEECIEAWNNNIDVLILDFKLVNMNGLEVLKEIKKKNPLAVVIMATAYSNEKLAIEALRLGAYNYIKKPYDINYLLSSTKEAIYEANLRKVSDGLSSTRIPNLSKGTGQESKSPVVRKLIDTIEKVSKKNISILLSGSSGTGKEHFADLIYKSSTRSGEKFIPINCPAIPASLAESELFGHEKGSFTGADAQKLGKLELGNGGMVFLDEVADLSLEIQAKLLRVLQEREIYRVGGTKPIPINVQIISATSKDLRVEIDEGRFRADLFYRIADINLSIPDLKDRLDDIDALSSLFIKEYAKENSEEVKKITPEGMAILKSYHWPGNIRELKSFIRKLMILVAEDTIDASTIKEYFDAQLISINTTHQEANTQSSSPVESNVIPQNEEATTPSPIANPSNIKDMEKELILNSIQKNNSNLTLVAQEIGMSRSTLYRKLKKYGIETK